jgi:tetratricopeptide (TPR) repeat protein
VPGCRSVRRCSQLISPFFLTALHSARLTCLAHPAWLQPQSPEAYANLASAYKDCGRHDEALESYRQALQLRSDFPEAFANYVHSLMCVCEWGDRPALFSRQAAARTGGPRGGDACQSLLVVLSLLLEVAAGGVYCGSHALSLPPQLTDVNVPPALPRPTLQA